MTKIRKGETRRKKPLNLQEHQTVQRGNWGSKYGESWGRKTGEQEKGDPGFQGCGAWCGVELLDPVNSILFSSFDTRAIVLAWSRPNPPPVTDNCQVPLDNVDARSKSYIPIPPSRVHHESHAWSYVHRAGLAPDLPHTSPKLQSQLPTAVCHSKWSTNQILPTFPLSCTSETTSPC